MGFDQMLQLQRNAHLAGVALGWIRVVGVGFYLSFTFYFLSLIENDSVFWSV